MPSIVESSSKDVTAAATAEQLISTSLLVISVTIRAKVTNTDVMYLGDSDVAAANAAPLMPGDDISMDGQMIDGTVWPFDLSEIWVDSAVNGEGVNFWYQRG